MNHPYEVDHYMEQAKALDMFPYTLITFQFIFDCMKATTKYFSSNQYTYRFVVDDDGLRLICEVDESVKLAPHVVRTIEYSGSTRRIPYDYLDMP